MHKDMAASSVQLAVTTFPETPQQGQVESPPSSPAQKDPESSDAVQVSIPEQANEQDPAISASETRKTAVKLAEQLQHSLNSQTTLKFEVRLHEKESGDGPGALSAFRFQVVDKDTGRIVRQFPPSEMLKITQNPQGILIDSDA